MFIQVSVAFFVFLWQRSSMPSVFKRRENIREKQRKSENFREFQRTLEKAFLKSIDARGVLPTFAPVEETRQRLEGFWLILNHLRIFLLCIQN
jgi:hypothetical protein